METRRQGTTLMTGICTFIATILIIQIWLVSAALEALLGGDHEVLLPAAVASCVLLMINAGLLYYAVQFDRRQRRRA